MPEPQQPDTVPVGTGAESKVVHLEAGRELCVRRDGAAVALSVWWPTVTGLASAGEGVCDPAVLRRVINALKVSLWEVEHAGVGQ